MTPKTLGARLAQGSAALLVLVAGVVGVPWVLILVAGNPFPASVDLRAWLAVLTSPDDGSVLAGLIAIVCWAAWLVFTVSVLAELIAVLTRRRIRIRLPGIGRAQKAAGGLILLVLAIFVAPQQLAAAQPGHSDEPTVSALPHSGGEVDRSAGPAAPSSADADDLQQESAGLVHLVRAGDDLWSLAERYYGDGQDWRRIATANPKVLSGGPDRLQPGWRLRIPGAGEAGRTVRVGAGETLTSIAEREYGDGSRWPEIHRANPQLADPDLLPVGVALTIPQAASEAGASNDRTGSSRNGTSDGAGQPDGADRPDSAEQSGDARAGDAGNATQSSRDRPVGPTVDEPTEAPTAAPTPTAPTPTAPTPTARSTAAAGPQSAAADPPGATRVESQTGSDRAAEQVLGVAGVGGLLAAGVITALSARRQLQLHARQPGRRIPHPPAPAQRLEARLGRQQTPNTWARLDLVLRAIGLDRRRRGMPLPRLESVRLAEQEMILEMVAEDSAAPEGMVADGRQWRLDRTGADQLIGTGDPAAPQPYPCLVGVGFDADGATVLVNTETTRLLAVGEAADGEWSGRAAAVLMAAVTELAVSPWADELVISVIGDDHGLAAAFDQHNVHTDDDLEQLLQRWEQRAAMQRARLREPGASSALDQRTDPDLADPWLPEIAFLTEEPSAAEAERLRTVLIQDPPVTLAAVVAAGPGFADWSLALGAGGSGQARLQPTGQQVRPQLIDAETLDPLRRLIDCTGSEQTETAPWWSEDFPPGTPGPARAGGATANDHEEPASPATQEWPSAATRPPSAADSTGATGSDTDGRRPSNGRVVVSEEYATVSSPIAGMAPPRPRHPTILLLGPIELIGTTGTPPSRAILQCIEYCTWLLEHPGCTAQAMAGGLVVAEGTRRSNMSRLRTWLGADDHGEPYLPDAYSGRIMLSPLVSSDWHRLQIITATGINRSSTSTLVRALELVRGAPLADAAPGQWHWAEEMRTDMVSVIRDIGLELATRALADSDVDLARWAAARSLTAAPQDELLLGARIRTELLAGNAGEVERIALQLSAHSRSLGIDLLPETVDLLQQAMEGGLRARA